jgi:ATP-binding cassette, subfamily C, bacterial LapB
MSFGIGKIEADEVDRTELQPGGLVQGPGDGAVPFPAPSPMEAFPAVPAAVPPKTELTEEPEPKPEPDPKPKPGPELELAPAVPVGKVSASTLAREGGALASLTSATDLSACLLPLLEALGWKGHARHIAESLPHFIDSLDVTGLRNVMASLRYESRPIRVRMKSVDPRLMPCMFIPDDGDALILLGVGKKTVRVFDGGANANAEIKRSRVMGTAYFFTRLEDDDVLPQRAKVGWFNAISERFGGLIYQALGITLILNILALATPLFVMAVYDKVVATGSLSTLAYFAVGVGIALVCDLVLRSIRSRILAFIGARLDNIVGNAVFQKILFLPPMFTERATIGAQVARMKDFESVRDFFTGPMALGHRLVISEPYSQ